MIEGTVEVHAIDALPPELGDRFAARTGFDPRTSGPAYRWFRITPTRVQAWREVNELPERELMRGGRWLPSTSEQDDLPEADLRVSWRARVGGCPDGAGSGARER
jgi:hypothetical protein